MQAIINNNPSIAATKEYWLYYYIKEDFSANFYALYHMDIDLDPFGFTVLQRNTRHAIEAYIDLVNLSNDPDYLSVLEYCAKKGKYNAKYHKYIQGKLCGVSTKYKIAKQLYSQDLPKLLKQIAVDNNSYVHPNVFVNIINKTDVDKKASILRNLLNMNLYVYTEAYKIMLQRFNHGDFPVLGCNMCGTYPKKCGECFDNEKLKFKNLVNNALFMMSNPFQPYYQQPSVF